MTFFSVLLRINSLFLKEVELALQYGLGLYAHAEETKEGFTKKYEEVIRTDKNLKEFYHNSLCWMMMRVDIGMVTKESIPVLLNRMNVVSSSWVREVEERLNFNMEDVLEKHFLGYTTNVITLSTAGFIKKRARVLKNQLGQFTDKQIEKSEEKEYD